MIYKNAINSLQSFTNWWLTNIYFVDLYRKFKVMSLKGKDLTRSIHSLQLLNGTRSKSSSKWPTPHFLCHLTHHLERAPPLPAVPKSANPQPILLQNHSQSWAWHWKKAHHTSQSFRIEKKTLGLMCLRILKTTKSPKCRRIELLEL